MLISIEDPSGSPWKPLGSRSIQAVVNDGLIPCRSFQLAGLLHGAVGTAITQALDPEPDVITLLQRDPQTELQALLDALEPI